MSQHITFESHVPAAQRSALEALVFFNSCQERVAECIASAVEKFGCPEIVSDRTRLRLRIGDLHDVQTLFAVEASTSPSCTLGYCRSMPAEAVVPVSSCCCDCCERSNARPGV